MIMIKNLTKKYHDNAGNFDINLEINTGEVLGILGPNGSGKTTLIRQIMGFIKPDSGMVDIEGYDPWKDRDTIMSKFGIGYVAGEVNLYDELTGEEYLNLVVKFGENIDLEYMSNLIKHFDINIKTKIKKMSKGMKQKIAIISATIARPKFLILDEPTSGLDPVMQEQFNKLLIKMKEQNTTIIICSHIFEEVVKICDRVIFIKDGSIIEQKNIEGNNDLNHIENLFKDLFSRKDFI